MCTYADRRRRIIRAGFKNPLVCKHNDNNYDLRAYTIVHRIIIIIIILAGRQNDGITERKPFGAVTYPEDD